MIHADTNFATVKLGKIREMLRAVDSEAKVSRSFDQFDRGGVIVITCEHDVPRRVGLPARYIDVVGTRYGWKHRYEIDFNSDGKATR